MNYKMTQVCCYLYLLLYFACGGEIAQSDSSSRGSRVSSPLCSENRLVRKANFGPLPSALLRRKKGGNLFGVGSSLISIKGSRSTFKLVIKNAYLPMSSFRMAAKCYRRMCLPKPLDVLNRL